MLVTEFLVIIFQKLTKWDSSVHPINVKIIKELVYDSLGVLHIGNVACRSEIGQWDLK